MPESFGARLRRQREEQGVALVTIADETKIKLSLLDALERDDVTHWPSGIFRRAYIRAYAQAIGLCSDVVLREFLEVHPDPPEVLAEAFAVGLAGDGARIAAGPPTRLRYLVDSALGSLSRLRRGPAVDAPGAADGTRIHAPAGPDVPAAAPRLQNNRFEPTTTAANPSPTDEPAQPAFDFLAVARLCTALGRVANADELQPLLQEAATILRATGAIVWIWDAAAEVLRPALAHGYSDKVLAQLPAVRRDADNATAASFRSGQACAIDASDDTSGALVVPLLTSAGCVGVLALEVRDTGQRAAWVGAAARIFAAMLAQLVAGRQDGEV